MLFNNLQQKPNGCVGSGLRLSTLRAVSKCAAPHTWLLWPGVGRNDHHPFSLWRPRTLNPGNNPRVYVFLGGLMVTEGLKKRQPTRWVNKDFPCGHRDSFRWLDLEFSSASLFAETKSEERERLGFHLELQNRKCVPELKRSVFYRFINLGLVLNKRNIKNFAWLQFILFLIYSLSLLLVVFGLFLIFWTLTNQSMSLSELP